MYIYVLTLKHEKFFVGRTNSFDFASKTFKNKWIKKNKNHNSQMIFEYIRYIDDSPGSQDNSKTHETNVVLSYMARYGIDNVRGGPFSKNHLSESDKRLILKTMRSKNGACARCGKFGHAFDVCGLIYKNPIPKLDSNLTESFS